MAFAAPTILGELKRYFRDTGWAVHVPRGTQELALRVQNAARELTDRHGRSPGVQEVAEFLEVSVGDVLEGLESGQAHFSVSLDAPVTPGAAEPLSLVETLGAPDVRYSFIETSAALSTGLRALPHRERAALTLRVRDDLKQSEIADRLGCSQMQVSRLLRQAGDRLRRQLPAH